jgi:hypothetical protein
MADTDEVVRLRLLRAIRDLASRRRLACRPSNRQELASELASTTASRTGPHAKPQVKRWALRDSNPRPSPCKGEAVAQVVGLSCFVTLSLQPSLVRARPTELLGKRYA